MASARSVPSYTDAFWILVIFGKVFVKKGSLGIHVLEGDPNHTGNLHYGLFGDRYLNNYHIYICIYIYTYICIYIYIRWTPPLPPVIVTIIDNKDYIRVLLYPYYTTITGWGVLLIYIYIYTEMLISSAPAASIAGRPVTKHGEHILKAGPSFKSLSLR